MNTTGDQLLRYENHGDQAQFLLRSMIEDDRFTDIQLQCQDGVIINSHRVLLAHTCQFFAKLVNKCQAMDTIYIPYDAATVRKVLEYLFHGEASINVAAKSKFLAIIGALDLKMTCHNKISDIQTKSCEELKWDLDMKPEGEEEKEEPLTHIPILMKKAATKKKDLQFICAECQLKTTTKRLLQTHVREVHKVNKIYQCDQCEYTGTLNGFNNHKQIHLGIWYQCDMCQYKTLKKGRLNEHVKLVHFKGDLHRCDQCNYASKDLKRVRYALFLRERHTLMNLVPDQEEILFLMKCN